MSWVLLILSLTIIFIVLQLDPHTHIAHKHTRIILQCVHANETQNSICGYEAVFHRGCPKKWVSYISLWKNWIYASGLISMNNVTPQKFTHGTPNFFSEFHIYFRRIVCEVDDLFPRRFYCKRFYRWDKLYIIGYKIR